MPHQSGQEDGLNFYSRFPDHSQAKRLRFYQILGLGHFAFLFTCICNFSTEKHVICCTIWDGSAYPACPCQHDHALGKSQSSLTAPWVGPHDELVAASRPFRKLRSLSTHRFFDRWDRSTNWRYAPPCRFGPNGVRNSKALLQLHAAWLHLRQQDRAALLGHPIRIDIILSGA